MSTIKVTNLRHESATSNNIALDSSNNVTTANNFTAGGTIGCTGNLTVTSGNVVLSSGNGIDFSATANHAGMSSELLDDYEEGVYAVTVTCGSGSITLDSNSQNLAYTKIGRLVHVQGLLVVSSVSSPSGVVGLSLPFTQDQSLSQNADNGFQAISVANAGIDADRWGLNVGGSTTMNITRYNRENPTATDAGTSFSGNESIGLNFIYLSSV